MCVGGPKHGETVPCSGKTYIYHAEGGFANIEHRYVRHEVGNQEFLLYEGKVKGPEGTPDERMQAVLAATFGGLHNAPRPIHKLHEGTPYEHWEVSTSQELATFDFNRLTALVVAAHDRCVRVSVVSSGPNMVKIVLFPRKGRGGSMSERHPTIEDALETIRMVERRRESEDA
jgi:hypothetical protein